VKIAEGGDFPALLRFWWVKGSGIDFINAPDCTKKFAGCFCGA
jgi:hypothetical protein